jgi:hypothetical protein
MHVLLKGLEAPSDLTLVKAQDIIEVAHDQEAQGAIHPAQPRRADAAVEQRKSPCAHHFIPAAI